MHAHEGVSTDVPKKPSMLRQRHAETTRRTILEAARALFVNEGYAQTSIRRLADEAGVAVQTIYGTFGSKPGVVIALLDLVDNEMVAPIAHRMMRSKDPAEMVELAASLERHVREANSDLLRVLAEGAASDAELKPMWEQGFDRHRQGVSQLVTRLAKAKQLRTELTADDAVATALALTSIEAYDEAVRHLGWSHDRYEQWLASALRHALLGATPS